MADQKISELTEQTSAAGEDLIHLVDDPSGTPINKKITVQSLFQNVPTELKTNSSFEANTNAIRISTSSTPANTATALHGEMRWDANYIYVATANNSWKRATLNIWDS